MSYSGLGQTVPPLLRVEQTLTPAEQAAATTAYLRSVRMVQIAVGTAVVLGTLAIVTGSVGWVRHRRRSVTRNAKTPKKRRRSRPQDELIKAELDRLTWYSSSPARKREEARRMRRNAVSDDWKKGDWIIPQHGASRFKTQAEAKRYAADLRSGYGFGAKVVKEESRSRPGKFAYQVYIRNERG